MKYFSNSLVYEKISHSIVIFVDIVVMSSVVINIAKQTPDPVGQFR